VVVYSFLAPVEAVEILPSWNGVREARITDPGLAK